VHGFILARPLLLSNEFFDADRLPAARLAAPEAAARCFGKALPDNPDWPSIMQDMLKPR
jgi:hypothetical protein